MSALERVVTRFDLSVDESHTVNEWSCSLKEVGGWYNIQFNYSGPYYALYRLKRFTLVYINEYRKDQRFTECDENSRIIQALVHGTSSENMIKLRKTRQNSDCLGISPIELAPTARDAVQVVGLDVCDVNVPHDHVIVVADQRFYDKYLYSVERLSRDGPYRIYQSCTEVSLTNNDSSINNDCAAEPSQPASSGNVIKKEESSDNLSTMVLPERSLSTSPCQNPSAENSRKKKMQGPGTAQCSKKSNFMDATAFDMSASPATSTVPDVPGTTFISTSLLKAANMAKRPATNELIPVQVKIIGSSSPGESSSVMYVKNASLKMNNSLCLANSYRQSRVRRSLSCNKNRMEYSSSAQMENQIESGTKEGLNDRYSTVPNAGDCREPSENAKIIKDYVKDEISTTEVENTYCQESAKPDKQEASKAASSSRHVKKEETNIDECSQDDETNEAGLRKRGHVEPNTTEANDDCDGGQFACLDCTAVFETNASFQVHIAFHEGYRKYQCTVCGQRFIRIDHLKVHMRRHTGEKPYKCDVCEKKFSTSGYLTQHKRIHTGDKPFECLTCQKRFIKRGDLQRHSLIHIGERPFKCDICDKNFTTSGDLTVHKRIHTGEKPFKCDVCKKRFTTSRDLTVHKRIHTGEKPFECDVCKKCFSQRGTLIAHKRIHTGETPYKCMSCGLCFRQNGTFKKHTLAHHSDADAGSQLDAPQEGIYQSSTIDACYPLDRSLRDGLRGDSIITDKV